MAISTQIKILIALQYILKSNQINMKKYKFIIIGFLSGLLMLIQKSSHSQDTTSLSNRDTSYWNIGGVSSLNVSQVSLTNWAVGGENSLSITGLADFFAKYKKGKVSWDNEASLGYGILKQGDSPVKKTDDKIDISSKAGYKASENWYYSAMISFKTQFYEGVKYLDNGSKTLISDFMSPAWLFYSIGMDFKPGEITKPLATNGLFGVDSFIL
jgi:hypothetical protein